MAIRDWYDDWRILVLNQEMPTDKEVKVGQEQKLAGDKTMPKKPRTGHNPTQ
jgi:hypothetical protein